MFNSTIDIHANYFYMPFGPAILDPKEVGLKRTSFTDIYVDKDTGIKWRKCLLFNTGWGQPEGFEKLPELKFNDLIKLALQSNHETTTLSVRDEESNKYGAIAVIMERHISELIKFLQKNLGNKELFHNELYRHNLTLFCFDAKEAKTNGGVGMKSYEDMLNQHTKWHQISEKVKEQVYKQDSGDTNQGTVL